MKKEHATKAPQEQEKQDTALPIISMVLGVISLTGPGLLLGIPAIITAAIALKRQQDGRGLSIAGLVTGIVSTVFSLLLIGLFIFLIILGLSAPDQPTHQNLPPQMHERNMFDATRT